MEVRDMPSICMFYGIIIYLYYEDHMPPHFHARYQDDIAAFTFDGELLSGTMPQKQCRLIAAWASIHEAELEANWSLVSESHEPFRIDPLR